MTEYEKFITSVFNSMKCKDLNESAINFYKRMGFKETDKKPLYKDTLEDEEKLEIAPHGYNESIEKYYLQMTYLKGNLNVN